MKTLLLCLFSISLHAAITANTVWEVRTTGTTTSGGGFDATISGAGTDMSIFDNINAAACSSCQSATVNISTTDAVTTNTTTVTSATGNFSSALIGNVIYLSGSGTTTGWYQVTAVGSSLSITVDRATGSTGGTGVTINIGGALGTIGASTAIVVAGNTVYVKATATYVISSGITTPNGALGSSVNYIGYTSTRGDNGRPTIQTSANSVTILTLGTYNKLFNFTLDANSKTTSTCLYLTFPAYVSHIECENFTANGIYQYSSSPSLLSNLYVHGGLSGCTAGIQVLTALVHNAYVNANACMGVLIYAYSSNLLNVISSNNTGATSDGFQFQAVSDRSTASNLVAYGNGRDGLRITNSNVEWTVATEVTNSVFVNNSGYGINSSATDTSTVAGLSTQINYNAFYNNTSGARHQVPTGANDVTLTGNPFNGAASNDFSLNNTAGAGKALRAAGFPGALLSGGTGYLDIGALQHADPVASGGQRVYTSIK